MMTKEQARQEMDRITHGANGLRVSFSPAERVRLDELRGIAFHDEVAPPTKGVRLDGKDHIPTASASRDDFFPSPIAAVVMEKNPALRQNAARALLAEVRSTTAMEAKHPYWNSAAGDHVAWQHGLAQVSRIALGED